MTEPEFQTLLERYLAGQCSPQERALVERWYDRLEQAEKPVLAAQSQQGVEKAIWQRLAPAVSKVRVMPSPAFWQAAPLRWAAALLVAVGVGALPFLGYRQSAPGSAVASADGWTRQTNSTGQPRDFQLPDGSRISLNPGSSLRYATAFGGPRREVHLVGEAFFRVHKNAARPFLVFTSEVVTTVLGTSFRVRAYPHGKQTTVAVREGKVAVQARQGAQLQATPARPAPAGMLLLPNQQGVYSAADRRLRKELVNKPAVLVPQSFVFEERPVTEVLAALEKAYGVDIVYDPAQLAGCTVSIAFYEEPLFEKLGLLCKALGAYYTLADAQVVLHSSGCQAALGRPTAPTD